MNEYFVCNGGGVGDKPAEQAHTSRNKPAKFVIVLLVHTPEYVQCEHFRM